MSGKGSILIAGRNKIITEKLKNLWENEGYTVFLAENGQRAWEFFLSERPRLIYIEEDLALIDSLQLLNYIRHMSQVPSIISGNRMNAQEALSFLKSGGDLVFRHEITAMELWAHGIRLLYRSGDAMEKGHVRSWNNRHLVVDFPCHEAWVEGKAIQLTPNEFKLLEILSGSDKVFTREELIARAFGLDYQGYDRTVDAHIKNLRAKIQRDEEYIRTVRGIGYRFVGIPD